MDEVKKMDEFDPNNFELETLPNITFRFATETIDPVEMLALSSQNFEDYKQLKVVYQFALEHAQVKIGEKMIPVKKGNVYMPVGIDKNFIALQELCTKFIAGVIGKAFMKSSE